MDRTGRTVAIGKVRSFHFIEIWLTGSFRSPNLSSRGSRMSLKVSAIYQSRLKTMTLYNATSMLRHRFPKGSVPCRI